MTTEELRYRRTVNRLALTMILFLLLFLGDQLALTLISFLTRNAPRVTAEVVYEISYGLLYALVFLLPVWFYGWVTPKEERVPISLSPTLPRGTVPLIFLGLAVVASTAYLNSYFVSIFHYSDFSSEVLWNHSVSANYQVILLFFTTAVVPAFVEEFLFRGLVLSQLLPYGRTVAVLASALLFGAMHQNAEQFFYATAAGVVFGIIYVYSGSLWCGVLIHFCNNAYSVLQSVISERLPSSQANLVMSICEVAVFAAGILGAVWLIRHAMCGAKRTATAASPTEGLRAECEGNGTCPQNMVPNGVSFGEDDACAIPMGRRVRLFFSPAMIVFLSICAVEMLFYLAFAFFFY